MLLALQRIANDLALKKVTLGDLWDSERKHEYLEKLSAEGILPNKAGSQGSPVDPDKPINPDEPKPKPKPKKQKTLIPQEEYGVVWTGEMERIQRIWDELQFHLLLEQHPNAIAVLFRVLLELSVDHSIKSNNFEKVKEADKLKDKIYRVTENLFQARFIDFRYRDDLRRMGRNDEIISIPSLNRFVHSYDVSPSPDHLKAMWNSCSKFVVLCLNEKIT